MAFCLRSSELFSIRFWVFEGNAGTGKKNPYAHEHDGEFAIQQDRYGFFATAADQVIKQTINKESKSAGGLFGITTRPNAVAKWILSQSQRLAMTQMCRNYANKMHLIGIKKILTLLAEFEMKLVSIA